MLADLGLAPDLEVRDLTSYLGPSVCKSRSRVGRVSNSKSVPTWPSGDRKGEFEVEETSEVRRKDALGISSASLEIERQYAENILALGVWAKCCAKIFVHTDPLFQIAVLAVPSHQSEFFDEAQPGEVMR